MKKSVEFLNEDTKKLNFYSCEEGSELTSQMIRDIASNCPSLEDFELNKVDIASWPKSLNTPWMLKRLTIFGCFHKKDLFQGKKLHLMLPRLESFRVFLNPGAEMTVPEKSKFRSLSDIRLCGGGTYRTQAGDVKLHTGRAIWG